MATWMLYGAYGYTGQLITQEAKNRGHNPILAGRSREKLIPIAEQHNLDYVIVDLKNEEKLIKSLEDVDLVFHAAGPYKYTSEPMVKACLKTASNYIDITGEVQVFEENFNYDKQAKDVGIAIISGVGFDVVPSDCLAKYVSEKIAEPHMLDLGITAMSNPSAGTLKTMLEHYDVGQLVRRNGKLIRLEKVDLRNIRFSDRERIARPVTWGDLATAYRTTKIPNITTYFPLPKKFPNLLESLGISPKEMINNVVTKKKVYKWIEKNIHGPDKIKRETYRCYLWAQVTNKKGEQAQAWVETMESYQFTAVAGVRCVEKLLELRPKGAITPALAFGADLILGIPKTIRIDSID
ncbi:MAG: saccharopine dehydrogenase family protein [Candidatus Thorarchaeota archaeon]